MILLDTCVLIWLASDQEKLSSGAHTVIAANAGNLYVSSMTSFEIAIKFYKKKLILPVEPQEWLTTVYDNHGIRELSVNTQIAVRSAGLPPLHSDPVDRIIVATAQINNMTLLSPDSVIQQYPDCTVAW